MQQNFFISVFYGDYRMVLWTGLKSPSVPTATKIFKNSKNIVKNFKIIKICNFLEPERWLKPPKFLKYASLIIEHVTYRKMIWLTINNQLLVGTSCRKLSCRLKFSFPGKINVINLSIPPPIAIWQGIDSASISLPFYFIVG